MLFEQRSGSTEDINAAEALASVLPQSPWLLAAVARAYRDWLENVEAEHVARSLYDTRVGNGRLMTLTAARELVGRFAPDGFLANMPARKRTGSAENPIPKLIPGRVAEQRFLEDMEALTLRRPAIAIQDDRETSHSLTDFTLRDPDEASLPINVKTASTPFRKAKELVGIDPEDCVPIPAYKAYGAAEAYPALLYVISVDYELAGKIDSVLADLLEPNEQVVWSLMGAFKGKWVRRAEDAFVNRLVEREWAAFRGLSTDDPFRVISALKALAILRDKPKRTPGIGLRAWGTGASAEVNVHIAVSEETRSLDDLISALAEDGVASVVAQIEKRVARTMPDPEW